MVQQRATLLQLFSKRDTVDIYTQYGTTARNNHEQAQSASTEYISVEPLCYHFFSKIYTIRISHATSAILCIYIYIYMYTYKSHVHILGRIVEAKWLKGSVLSRGIYT